MTGNKFPAAMSDKKNQLAELFDDATYLLEEIDALEEMIEVVPYNEKPFGQESVLEMLAKIACADCHLFIPLIRNIVQGHYNIPENIGYEIDKHGHSDCFDKTEPEEVFLKIRASRKETIELLESSFRLLHKGKVDSDPKNSGREVLECLMRKMIHFDRLQLKKIAEKVLSIDIEKK